MANPENQATEIPISQFASQIRRRESPREGENESKETSPLLACKNFSVFYNNVCAVKELCVEILFDEPTSALDPGSTTRIEDLMLELHGKYTIIIVTHNMQQATRFSDYTMFLFKGELIEFSRTGDLFTKPKHKQTERYITGHFG